MATHSSTLAWKIPWTEEPGRLQSMGLGRVGHDWATSLSCIGEGNGNQLQCFCLENPRDGGAWWASVYGVAQSRTWLKRLSSSSTSLINVKSFIFYILPIILLFPLDSAVVKKVQLSFLKSVLGTEGTEMNKTKELIFWWGRQTHRLK